MGTRTSCEERRIVTDNWATDENTGLVVPIPEGWNVLETDLVAIVMRDSIVTPNTAIASTIVVTVAEAPAQTTLPELTRLGTTAWSDSTHRSSVIEVGVVVAEDAGIVGREVVGISIEGDRALVVVTHLFLSQGIVTRIDLTCGVWQAPASISFARSVTARVRFPSTASRAVPDPQGVLAVLIREAAARR